MAEPLSEELRIYLRCARDELLLDTPPEDDPFKPHRVRRVAAALNHLIARTEVLTDIEAAMEPKAQALLALARSRVAPLGIKPHADPRPAAAAPAWAQLVALLDELSKAAATSEESAAVARWLIGAVRDLEAWRLTQTQQAVNDLATRDAVKPANRGSELLPLTAVEVEQFVRTTFAAHVDVRITDFAQSKSVNSKENYRFEILGVDGDPIPAILRRDRNFEIVPSSAANEFDLLNQLHARGMPVARCLAVQYDDAPPLRRPSLLMVRAAGSPLRKLDPKSLARVDAKSVTPEMILQLAAPLARLHLTATEGLALPQGATGLPNRELFLARVTDYHERLHRFQRDQFPIIEAAFSYLYVNAHLIDGRQTLVHADFDLRNVMFDAGRLSVILDFELAHLGHPGEDLGYLRNDIEPLMSWPEFLAAYQAAGGPRVDDALVRYFQVWAWAFRGACNVAAFSGYRSGVHADVFLGTLPFVETQFVQHRLVDLLARANGADSA